MTLPVLASRAILAAILTFTNHNINCSGIKLYSTKFYLIGVFVREIVPEAILVTRFCCYITRFTLFTEILSRNMTMRYPQ